MLESDSILDLDTNPVVDLLADCCHLRPAPEIAHKTTLTHRSKYERDTNGAFTPTTRCQMSEEEGPTDANSQPKQMRVTGSRGSKICHHARKKQEELKLQTLRVSLHLLSHTNSLMFNLHETPTSRRLNLHASHHAVDTLTWRHPFMEDPRCDVKTARRSQNLVQLWPRIWPHR